MVYLPIPSSLCSKITFSWGLSWPTYLKLQVLTFLSFPAVWMPPPLYGFIPWRMSPVTFSCTNLFSSILLFLVCISPLILVSSMKAGIFYIHWYILNVYNCARYIVDVYIVFSEQKSAYNAPGTANHRNPHFNLRGLRCIGLKCPQSHN